MFEDLGYSYDDLLKTLPALDSAWLDTTYGNDACPSAENAALRCRIWFEYDKPEMRESGGEKFTLIRGTYGDPDDQEVICATDDWCGILDALDGLRFEKWQASRKWVTDGDFAGYEYDGGGRIEWCKRPKGYLVEIERDERFFPEADERDGRPLEEAEEYLWRQWAEDTPDY